MLRRNPVPMKIIFHKADTFTWHCMGNNYYRFFDDRPSHCVSINDGIDIITINLYDMLGEKVIETIKTQSTQSTIDLSKLSQGIYFLEAIMDGEKVVRKVVKMD